MIHPKNRTPFKINNSLFTPMNTDFCSTCVCRISANYEIWPSLVVVVIVVVVQIAVVTIYIERICCITGISGTEPPHENNKA